MIYPDDNQNNGEENGEGRGELPALKSTERRSGRSLSRTISCTAFYWIKLIYPGGQCSPATRTVLRRGMVGLAAERTDIWGIGVRTIGVWLRRSCCGYYRAA